MLYNLLHTFKSTYFYALIFPFSDLSTFIFRKSGIYCILITSEYDVLTQLILISWKSMKNPNSFKKADFKNTHQTRHTFKVGMWIPMIDSLNRKPQCFSPFSFLSFASWAIHSNYSILLFHCVGSPSSQLWLRKVNQKIKWKKNDVAKLGLVGSSVITQMLSSDEFDGQIASSSIPAVI